MRLLRRKEEAPINVMPAPTGWAVRVTPGNYRDQIAVMLLLNGSAQMVFGHVEIHDDAFEDKITTMKAAAEEKAATLNAVGAI